MGDDAFGRQGRELWATEGVDASFVRSAAAPTMAGFILVEADGENRIAIAPGALRELSAADVEGFRGQLAAADAAIVSLEIPLETALSALRIAHEEGTTTVLNPAPAASIPTTAWKYVDVLTPNLSEATALVGDGSGGTPEAVAGRLRTLTGAIVVMTLGAEGAAVADESGARRIPPIPAARVIDTTGAGDAFTAALATALAAGQPTDSAVAFAAHAGAYTVASMEVIPALPHREDLPRLEDLTPGG